MAKVADRAERVGVEGDAVATVVERVEDHPERIVVAQLAGVAPHLVRHPLARWRRVPHPRAHIDVRAVEHDPGGGPLGRRGPFVRHQLNETGDGRDGLIDGLVEYAVEPDALAQLDGADGGASLVVPRDHLWWERGRRAVARIELGQPAGAQRRAGADQLPGVWHTRDLVGRRLG